MSGSNSSPPAAEPSPVLDQPLGLTVHSLPLPQEAALEDAQRTRTGRWKMLLVMLVCAAPVVASYFTYYVIRPEGRRNFGELIEPQPDALDADPEELLQRVAFGTPDVLAAVQALRARGVDFVESPTGVHTDPRGALTRADATSPSFELVRSVPASAA